MRMVSRLEALQRGHGHPKILWERSSAQGRTRVRGSRMTADVHGRPEEVHRSASLSRSIACLT